jgi:hypothetical protein
MNYKLTYIFFVTFFFLIFSEAFSQRILINQNFENTGFGPDSLPPGWVKFNEDPWGGYGRDWAVRDSGTGYVGTSVNVKAKAHNSKRALTIPWSAGGSSGIANDWVITDSLRIQNGDSLIFWMLFGSQPPLQAYMDSMQVWAMLYPYPATTLLKLATLFSLDSNNVWTQFKFNLSQFSGQTIYIAFRYYMDVSVDGLWCNIDDVFVGNRAGVGVNQIGTNIPKRFFLGQNYPNPFNPTTNIRFDIARRTNVKITIFNSLGQIENIILNEIKVPGYYEVNFDGSYLSSGIYYYRIETLEFIDTKKMVLIK